MLPIAKSFGKIHQIDWITLVYTHTHTYIKVNEKSLQEKVLDIIAVELIYNPENYEQEVKFPVVCTIIRQKSTMCISI